MPRRAIPGRSQPSRAQPSQTEPRHAESLSVPRHPKGGAAMHRAQPTPSTNAAEWKGGPSRG